MNAGALLIIGKEEKAKIQGIEVLKSKIHRVLRICLWMKIIFYMIDINPKINP